jgi:Fe-S oxidoreductase
MVTVRRRRSSMPQHTRQPVDDKKINELLQQKKRRMRFCLEACASCSLCAESCFLFMGHDKDPRYMPSYKVVHSLGTLYRKKGKVSRAQLEEMKELIWRNCVLCGRCYCPFGIDIPYMIAFARRILRTQGIYGCYPHTVGGPDEESGDGVSLQGK